MHVLQECERAQDKTSAETVHARLPEGHDELEPATQSAIENAREVLDSVNHDLSRFHVRYSRIVIMETEVLAESAEEIVHMPLPGVYAGISADKVPPHVKDVQDYDHVWDIEPA